MSGAARSSSLIDSTGSKSFASQYNLLVEIQMFLDFFYRGRSGFSTSKMHNKAARTYSDREN